MAIVDPQEYLKTIKMKNSVDIRLYELENTVRQIQRENERLSDEVQLLKLLIHENTRYEQVEDRILLKLDGVESKLSSDINRSNFAKLGKFNPFRGM